MFEIPTLGLQTFSIRMLRDVMLSWDSGFQVNLSSFQRCFQLIFMFLFSWWNNLIYLVNHDWSSKGLAGHILKKYNIRWHISTHEYDRNNFFKQFSIYYQFKDFE